MEGNGYEGRQTSKGELFVKVFGMSRDFCLLFLFISYYLNILFTRAPTETEFLVFFLIYCCERLDC